MDTKVILHPKEKKRQEIDQKFQKAGHEPENTSCNHRQWNFEKHGSVCPCGTWMVDFGF